MASQFLAQILGSKKAQPLPPCILAWPRGRGADTANPTLPPPTHGSTSDKVHKSCGGSRSLAQRSSARNVHMAARIGTTLDDSIFRPRFDGLANSIFIHHKLSPDALQRYLFAAYTCGFPPTKRKRGCARNLDCASATWFRIVHSFMRSTTWHLLNAYFHRNKKQNRKLAKTNRFHAI
jgi:hypothetical protein